MSSLHWLIWALFQNDDGGPYGNGFYPATPWGAVRWWLRNPCHNLLWHVLNWPGGPFWKWGSVPGWNGYLGFRPGSGAFGIAIRKETSAP